MVGSPQIRLPDMRRLWRAALAVLDNKWVNRAGNIPALIFIGSTVVGIVLVGYAGIKILVRGGFDVVSIVLLAVGIVLLATLVYFAASQSPATPGPSSDAPL